LTPTAAVPVRPLKPARRRLAGQCSTERSVQVPNNDKLAETHEHLVRAIEDVVSGDDWLRFLRLARRSHAYSTGGTDISKLAERGRSFSTSVTLGASP
jgi:hypothetical protein